MLTWTNLKQESDLTAKCYLLIGGPYHGEAVLDRGLPRDKHMYQFMARTIDREVSEGVLTITFCIPSAIDPETKSEFDGLLKAHAEAAVGRSISGKELADNLLALLQSAERAAFERTTAEKHKARCFKDEVVQFLGGNE